MFCLQPEVLPNKTIAEEKVEIKAEQVIIETEAEEAAPAARGENVVEDRTLLSVEEPVTAVIPTGNSGSRLRSHASCPIK